MAGRSISRSLRQPLTRSVDPDGGGVMVAAEVEVEAPDPAGSEPVQEAAEDRSRIAVRVRPTERLIDAETTTEP
jgi:hypothetical protein